MFTSKNKGKILNFAFKCFNKDDQTLSVWLMLQRNQTEESDLKSAWPF